MRIVKKSALQEVQCGLRQHGLIRSQIEVPGKVFLFLDRKRRLRNAGPDEHVVQTVPLGY